MKIKKLIKGAGSTGIWVASTYMTLLGGEMMANIGREAGLIGLPVRLLGHGLQACAGIPAVLAIGEVIKTFDNLMEEA